MLLRKPTNPRVCGQERHGRTFKVGFLGERVGNNEAPASSCSQGQCFDKCRISAPATVQQDSAQVFLLHNDHPARCSTPLSKMNHLHTTQGPRTSMSRPHRSKSSGGGEGQGARAKGTSMPRPHRSKAEHLRLTACPLGIRVTSRATSTTQPRRSQHITPGA